MTTAFSIEISGVSYPAVLTNGAVLRYAQQTGKELSDIQTFGDWLMLLWCCIVSGCKREGIPFTMTFEDFTEATTPEDIQRWVTAVDTAMSTADGDGPDATAEKKSTAS